MAHDAVAAVLAGERAWEAEAEKNRALLKGAYCDKGRHFWQAIEFVCTDRPTEPDDYYWAAYTCNVCGCDQALDLNGPLLTPDGSPYEGNPIIDWITDDDGRIVEARNGLTGVRLWPFAEAGVS